MEKGTRIQETAIDYFGRERTFSCEAEGTPTKKRLEDTLLKVRTYYIDDINDNYQRLNTIAYRRDIENPPAWQLQSLSAHANTCDVAKFFTDVLDYLINEENEETTHYISNIVCSEDNSNQKNCENAFWSEHYQQAFFGQQLIFNSNKSCHELCCYAVAKDIVAHEFTHALTSWTAKLEYRGESGALDESYADIFAIMIQNFPNENIEQWNWEIGSGFGTEGRALRSLNNTSNYHSTVRINGKEIQIPHPQHMNDYQNLPFTNDGDWGGVHINCGIHNKAAYNLLNSRSEYDGSYLFEPRIAAEIFYQALTQLTPTSGFSESFRAIQQVAKTLFYLNKDPVWQEKLGAIAKAFQQVGISE